MTGSRRSRRPDLGLVIGAQKSATSSLHAALASCDDLEVLEKELGLFDPATDRSLDTVAALAGLDPARLSIEIATRYTMLPEVDGVQKRLAEHLDPAAVAAVYIVRDPILRIASHLKHDQLLGRTTGTLSSQLRAEPRYLQNSSYHRQLLPWTELLGADRVLVLDFDEVTNSMAATVDRVREHFAMPPSAGHLEGVQIWENRTDANPKLGRFVGGFLDSQLYRRTLRPLLGSSVRRIVVDRLRSSDRTGETASGTPEQTAENPSILAPADVEWILEHLEGDIVALNEAVPASLEWFTVSSLADRHLSGSSGASRQTRSS